MPRRKPITVLLTELDGQRTLVHSLVTRTKPPLNIKEIQQIRGAVMAAQPDTWSYGDVNRALRMVGYTVDTNFALVWESNAPYPEGSG